MEIRWKRTHEAAKVPSISFEGDAGFDLCTTCDITLAPGERAKIPSGLSLELPLGYVGLIWDKSGVSNNHGLKTLGGVIDAGYRGEILVGMVNLGSEPHAFKKGEKVAQLLIQKVEHPTFVEVDELGDTSRGAGGFGSSGK